MKCWKTEERWWIPATWTEELRWFLSDVPSPASAALAERRKGLLTGEAPVNYEQRGGKRQVTQYSWFCLSGFPTKSEAVIQACSQDQPLKTTNPVSYSLSQPDFTQTSPMLEVLDSHLVTSRLSGGVEKISSPCLVPSLNLGQSAQICRRDSTLYRSGNLVSYNWIYICEAVQFSSVRF